MTAQSTTIDDDFGIDVPDVLLNYQLDTSKLRSDEKYIGFDNNVGDTWIYPTNYPVRKYQYDITKLALFKNVLVSKPTASAVLLAFTQQPPHCFQQQVVLPTGLGKTFLAAVVMYNFYRWYPRGKVIFMAPTRPLVAQQIEACYQIMGIPKEDTIELTGKQQKRIRLIAWHEKRVFFVTPQVLASDLPDADFPVNDIKLLVVDEAHKAKGKYAYTEVVAAILPRNKLFRVLALSATPGRSLTDVAEVVRNLLISHIEVRSESSPDVLPYTFKKNIQTIVVKMDRNLVAVRNELIDIIDPYVRNLLDMRAVQGSTSSLSKGWLVMQQKKFVEESYRQRDQNHSQIMSDFSSCISLYHALELLERHGLRIFLNFFDDPDNKKYYLTRDGDLMEFIARIRHSAGPNPVESLPQNGDVSHVPDNLDFGHPKFDILRKCLLEHFQAHPESRSIIFCEFRESVYMIYQVLLQHRPMLKPKVFVGKF